MFYVLIKTFLKFLKKELGVKMSCLEAPFLDFQSVHLPRASSVTASITGSPLNTVLLLLNTVLLPCQTVQTSSRGSLFIMKQRLWKHCLTKTKVDILVIYWCIKARFRVLFQVNFPPQRVFYGTRVQLPEKEIVSSWVLMQNIELKITRFILSSYTNNSPSVLKV